MDIRVLSPMEMEKAIALWQYCFQDDEAFTHWYFSKRAGDVLAAGEDRLRAMAVTVPARFNLRGQEKGGFLVSGIATAPEYRGRGIMREFMPLCHTHLRENGAALAGLYPFDYSFYQKFGWEPCADCIRVCIPLSRLPLGRLSGEFTVYDSLPCQEEDFAELYARCYGRYSGSVLRDAAAFAQRLTEAALDNGFAALYQRDGKIEGYILYRFEGKIIHVEEYAALTHIARADLLTFLAGHSSSMEETIWISPPDDPLWRLLPDARGAAVLEPRSMLRIIDVERALSGLPCGVGELLLRVEDSHAAWNDGVWHLFDNNGRLRVQRTDKKPDAWITIGQLTQWAVGYHTADQLCIGGADNLCAVSRRMDELLPQCHAFLFEMY